MTPATRRSYADQQIDSAMAALRVELDRMDRSLDNVRRCLDAMAFQRSTMAAALDVLVRAQMAGGKDHVSPTLDA